MTFVCFDPICLDFDFASSTRRRRPPQDFDFDLVGMLAQTSNFALRNVCVILTLCIPYLVPKANIPENQTKRINILVMLNCLLFRSDYQKILRDLHCHDVEKLWMQIHEIRVVLFLESFHADQIDRKKVIDINQMINSSTSLKRIVANCYYHDERNACEDAQRSLPKKLTSSFQKILSVHVVGDHSPLPSFIGGIVLMRKNVDKSSSSEYSH